MLKQRIDRLLAAVHKIDNALRQTGLRKQFESVPHGQRHPLRWLQHQRIPAGDCIRQKPERNHPGKIEWRNRGNNSERLTDHSFVNSARDIFEVVALHHHGNAAGYFHVFDSATQLGLRLG